MPVVVVIESALSCYLYLFPHTTFNWFHHLPSIFHYYQQDELVCDSKWHRNTQLPKGKVADFMEPGSEYPVIHVWSFRRQKKTSTEQKQLVDG